MEQKEKIQDKITETVNKLVSFMNFECQVEFREEREAAPEGSEPRPEGRGALFVSLFSSDNAKLLIGKDGQALKALEHVLRLILVKDKEIPQILLDVNDYRKSRVNYLVD